MDRARRRFIGETTGVVAAATIAPWIFGACALLPQQQDFFEKISKLSAVEQAQAIEKEFASREYSPGEIKQKVLPIWTAAYKEVTGSTVTHEQVMAKWRDQILGPDSKPEAGGTARINFLTREWEVLSVNLSRYKTNQDVTHPGEPQKSVKGITALRNGYMRVLTQFDTEVREDAHLAVTMFKYGNIYPPMKSSEPVLCNGFSAFQLNRLRPDQSDIYFSSLDTRGVDCLVIDLNKKMKLRNFITTPHAPLLANFFQWIGMDEELVRRLYRTSALESVATNLGDRSVAARNLKGISTEEIIGIGINVIRRLNGVTSLPELEQFYPGVKQAVLDKEQVYVD